MKVCAFIVFVVTYRSFAYNVTTSVDIHKFWERTVSPFSAECIYRTGVRQELVDDFFNYGKMTDDPHLKCYFYCAGSKLQVFTAGCNTDAKTMSEIFDYIDLPLAQKCSDITDEDPCQKAYLVVKCVHDDILKEFPQQDFVNEM